MKHPEDEQWVSWIFGEAGVDQARELSAHRNSCPECDRRIGNWERTLRRLEPGEGQSIERHRSPVPVAWPAASWAAAAAVLLFGLATGWATRSISSAANETQLRADLQSRWDQQLQALRSEMTAEMAAQIQQARTADSVDFLLTITDLQESYSAQIAALREDLEVMAFNTHATLEVAEQKLVQLSLDPVPGPTPSP